MADPFPRRAAAAQLLEVVSPRGKSAAIFVRPDTNDAATLHSTFWPPGAPLTDEYGLADIYVDGWALDVGAHIGSVTLALAIDNPTARIVAIEAVPENAALLQRSVEYLKLEERVFVVSASAGRKHGSTTQFHYGYYDVPGVSAQHAEQVRFIGNLFRTHGPRGKTVTIPVVSLAGILDRFGIAEFEFAKSDAEGAEWEFFSDPQANAHIAAMIGEFHDRPAPAIHKLLAATHDVTVYHYVPDEVIGMFRAVRR